MSLSATLQFIITHPLCSDQKLKSILRFVKWQINSRLNSKPIIVPFIGDNKIIVERGTAAATGNLYTGLHEFSEMSFMLHLLRDNDLFIDIGANIGSYTILASGYKKAKTIAIEPAHKTFRKLLQNIELNNISDKVDAYNLALGSNKSKVRFTSTLDSENHVLLHDESALDSTDINMDVLDNIVEDLHPILMKIDVEGFETEVLKGAENGLKKDSLRAIIIELNGSGKRYGYDEKKIHQLLLENNFLPYLYNPFKREFSLQTDHGNQNTIYIRDVEFVKERIKGSTPILIFNKSF